MTRVRVTLLLASASVRNRSQPSATVRNRSPAAVVGAKLPCLWESRKKVIFSTCQKMWSYRFAWQAWRFVTFQHVSRCVKSRFCVADAILFPRFHTMRRIFCGKRSTLKIFDVILRGRRSTLDVSRCAFSTNRIVSAARSGDKVQIPWQAWHFVTCHENRRMPRTKRRFCSRSRKKTRRKTLILTLRSVKLEEVLHEMLALMLQHVSSCLAGVALRVAGVTLCDIPRV